MYALENSVEKIYADMGWTKRLLPSTGLTINFKRDNLKL